MRLENLVIGALCGAAVIVAVVVSWRGRNLLIAAPVEAPQTPSAAARDAVRSLAIVAAAGVTAGVLVVGLGGRLVMRILGATSGDGAQGRLTEAGEVVGEITFGGTVAFVIFVGFLIPAAASLLFVPVRRLVPNRAWIAGSLFGLLLLATFGVADPLSADNVDFEILSPLPLAVALVAGVAVLFGTTFAAVVGHLEVSTGRLTETGLRGKAPYLALVVLAIPVLFVPAMLYIGGRAIARGRVGALLRRRHVAVAAQVLVVVGIVACCFIVGSTISEIV